MLYLIGFMGVGKSTIGHLLAKQLKLPFVDTDKEIETKEKQDILSIFNQNGENHFRNIEHKIIKNIKGKCVVACGGGLPLSNNNMSYLKSQGISIYLKASKETLYERLKKEIKKRPLLYKKSDNELKIFIQKNLIRREIIYKQANHIINTDNLKKNEILRQIHSLPLSF